MQVYTANESSSDVYFDDMQLQQYGAVITQVNHYDPWGLNLNDIELAGNPNHRFQYNGKEKQEELGLEWNDYGARFELCRLFLPGTYSVGKAEIRIKILFPFPAEISLKN